jgi:hypothetical protein
MRRWLAFLFLVPIAAWAGEYSGSDRQALLQHLSNSRAALSATLETITQEQSTFKPDSKTWSVIEVIEHLYLTEDFLRGIATDAMAKTQPVPDTEKLPDPSEMDRTILQGIADRRQKAQAPEQAVPKDQFRNRDEAFTAFAQRRQKTEEWVREAKQDLRRYRIQSPVGTLDVHQWMLMLSAHTIRHTQQIEELMRHEMFPKPQ